MGTLQDRVVIVTGGGRGIGLEHARCLANEGAMVVVNDLGGAGDGSGSDASAAAVAAEEICAAGGRAIANGDDVGDPAGAKRIVEAAVDGFGDLHAIVNNAGILRDRMLVSMTEAEFDDVIAVHLKGTFNVTQQAARWWREETKADRKTDRSIINTSSGAGLHGNVGQTNYAAAKAGIAAMTIVNAMELRSYGVRANCIAPVARTRLTLATPGMGENLGGSQFDPENISPLVACLAAAGCRFNGQIFSVYGGSVGLYRGWSIDESVSTEGRWTPAELTEAMAGLPKRIPVNDQFSIVGGGKQ